jgi:hypothetical protein
MLTIAPELATAFETGTLSRWKTEIAATLRKKYPGPATAFTCPALEDWVRQSMDCVRRLGATSRGDIELFAVTLFGVTEAGHDPRAAGDFTAVMLAPGTLAAKMAFLRKGFTSPSG